MTMEASMAQREEPPTGEELEQRFGEREHAESLTDLIDLLQREAFQRRSHGIAYGWKVVEKKAGHRGR